MTNKNEALGPVTLISAAVVVVAIAATVVWFVARAQAALIYGLVRTVELPVVSNLLPYSEFFSLGSLRTGVVPSFEMIYWNSLVVGLFFTALTLGLCFIALGRVEKHHIKKYVEITDPKGIKFGRSYPEIMSRYAVTQPDVQFFNDYDLLDLSVMNGTGRQALPALEFLVYIGGIKSVIVDAESGKPPEIELNKDRVISHFADRAFGPTNPFQRIVDQQLTDVASIESAVDDLRWDAALILDGALRRVQAFWVENEADGFKSINADIAKFHKEIWTEINSLKSEFGRGITLGYNSEDNRREREAAYLEEISKKGKKPAGTESKGTADFRASVSLEALSTFDKVKAAGKYDLGRPPEHVDPELRAKYGEKDGWKNKGRKREPDELLFVGEILALRGPQFKCVATARSRLKTMLTRHLGLQTGQYPVGVDDKKETRYASKIANGSEQAFNAQAQQRLNIAAKEMGKIIFGHTWTFGVVGHALDVARQSGIMPPNLFRYMRFSSETLSLWWFVQNLGSPSALPENSALMEHYNAERATGMALRKPYIKAALDGLKKEAEKYLVPETTEDLISCLGQDVLVDKVRERRKEARDAVRDVTGQPISSTVGKILGGDTYRPEFFENLALDPERQKKQKARAAAASTGTPASPDVAELADAVAEETGMSAMEALRRKVIPGQFEILRERESLVRAARREQGHEDKDGE